MKKYWRSFAKLLILLAVLYLIISSVMLVFSVNKALAVKNRADIISQAIDDGQFNRALHEILDIQDELASAKQLQKPSKWILGIPVIRVDYAVYDQLLSAGQQLTESFGEIIGILESENISEVFSLDTIDLANAAKAYLEVHDNIISSINHLESAAKLSENLHTSIMPGAVQETVKNLQQNLASSLKIISQYKPYLEILPYFLGSPEAQEVLFLLQNPDELRPTGGFIGTFGRLTINKGVIQQFFTDDIYNVDVHVLGREQEVPPEPIQKYTNVEYWYLRDANWSPDFPTSAQKVIELYEYESSEQGIDSVIAINPFLVQEILRITGPIEVDDILFDENNLIDKIQFRVEQEFLDIGLVDEERKVVINNLAQALKERIFRMSKDEFKAFLLSFQQALDRKEILVYTRDPVVQDLIISSGWGGQIVSTDSDYLFIVDANLGALKTDRLVDRSRNYTLTEQDDGRWLARLEIRYKNNGFFDYRTTRYRTYTRIYVPLGSEFHNSSGFVTTDKSVDYVDPIIYSEFGKTVFAGFLSIEPGQERFAVIEYLLPRKISESIEQDLKYDLYVQKQPGVKPFPISVEINSRKKLFSFSPSKVNYEVVNQNNLIFDDLVEQDTSYTVIFVE